MKIPNLCPMMLFTNKRTLYSSTASLSCCYTIIISWICVCANNNVHRAVLNHSAESSVCIWACTVSHRRPPCNGAHGIKRLSSWSVTVTRTPSYSRAAIMDQTRGWGGGMNPGQAILPVRVFHFKEFPGLSHLSVCVLLRSVLMMKGLMHSKMAAARRREGIAIYRKRPDRGVVSPCNTSSPVARLPCTATHRSGSIPRGPRVCVSPKPECNTGGVRGGGGEKT